MSLATLALLALAAPPSAGDVHVAVPRPARDLARLAPFLEWAGALDPSLRPETLIAAVRPLGIDPFRAPKEAWTEAGLDPEGPAQLWRPAHGRARASLAVGEEGRLRAYLEGLARRGDAKGGRASVRTATAADTWGFVAGPPGRPRLVGAADGGGRIWLRRHRSLLTRDPDERAAYAGSLVQRLAGAVAGFSPPRRPRLPRRGRPDRAPEAWVRGSGPAPVAGWRGGLWVEPDRFVGAARLELTDLAALFARDWLPRRAPRRLLAPHDEVAAELVTRAQPSTLVDALPSRPKALAELTSGTVHAALTARGSLVVALELRPGTKPARMKAAALALAEATPGLRFSLEGAPRRLVLWFAGADEAEVKAWLGRAPKGRAPSPAWGRLEPGRVLGAIRARDAARDGPTFGTGRTMLLGAAYGRFLERTGEVTVRAAKAASGVDVVVQITR